MVVAVVGASNDRRKFGNKAVRAYVGRGFDVYPVNNHEDFIEGLKAYRSVLDIPVGVDRVSLYLPPASALDVMDDIFRKGTSELFLNPGSESKRVIEKAEALGLNPILACSVIDIGESPGQY
ncbi:MAG: CoA-binding protein [Candidatus Krumholzibacteria bacterium]|nr:CoA-binding protein [Candidatus Krumholzibacteria bacterium]